ncbi:MAG TPA: septum site-determining protein MinC [Tissierellaceae bacterium]|nr:septum site-determining protein MinC [Tissierellaceae bacterium]
MVKNDIIAFKGVKEGVYLEIQSSNMAKIKEELKIRMDKFFDFFQGTKFLGIRAEELTPEEILEINLILKYKYEFDLELEEDLIKSIAKPDKSLDVSVEGMTRFLHGTLRSGQIIEYNGNIVVVGDVNPGAVLKASGNIIVLGSLKGVAYAGLENNEDAIVAAYHLLPTQLRIGDIIVRAPDGDVSQYKLPEIARLDNGAIVIEPYLPNK